MNLPPTTTETNQDQRPPKMTFQKKQYLTIGLQPNEMDFIYEIRKSMSEQYGQTLAKGDVVRAMLRKGLDNIDFDACKEDPILLFERGSY